MSELIISVSGLRGIVGESLTPEVVVNYVGACARHLPPGPVVVSRDGRTTGRMIADLVCGALRAAGRLVINADVAATPTTGVFVRQASAAGGIQISASHNPPAYNGMKLFGGDGRVVPAPFGAKVAEDYHRHASHWQPWQEVGESRTHPDPHAEHLRSVLALVDVAGIRERRFPVLLDSNCGAGSRLGRRLLRALNCQLTVLGGEPDGRFLHKPEPTAENLRGVGREVVAAKAIVGFCQDPDADRLALINSRGEYVGEEYTLALCMDHVLRVARSNTQGALGAVVTNCATSRMSQDIAEQHGATFLRAAVGEANVADVMIRHQAIFGGEGNGGPIDPRVGYVRDSFVGMALILDALAARDHSLEDWIAGLPSYAIYKDKAPLERERIADAMDRLQQQFAEAEVSRQDGLRLDWSDRWLLLRPSNTEPIIRAIAEAPTLEEARQLCERALRAVG